jgi:hypothetical protein
MRFAVIMLVLATALSACRHVSAPEEHPSEAEIRAHIPGTWISQDDPRWHGWRTITFGPDGTFVVGLANGADEVFGTWRVHDWTFVITTTKTNYITNLESGERHAIPPGDVMVFPVVSIREHQLLYRPGITVAEVRRFRR